MDLSIRETEEVKEKEGDALKVTPLAPEVPVLPLAPKPQGMVYNPVGEKKVTIMIEEQEGDENSGDVFVSINGFAYQIRRGFEVSVPESVVEILRNAITTKMWQDKQTDEIKFRNVPRFNFRVIN